MEEGNTGAGPDIRSLTQSPALYPVSSRGHRRWLVGGLEGPCGQGCPSLACRPSRVTGAILPSFGGLQSCAPSRKTATVAEGPDTEAPGGFSGMRRAEEGAWLWVRITTQLPPAQQFGQVWKEGTLGHSVQAALA